MEVGVVIGEADRPHCHPVYFAGRIPGVWPEEAFCPPDVFWYSAIRAGDTVRLRRILNDLVVFAGAEQDPYRGTLVGLAVLTIKCFQIERNLSYPGECLSLCRNDLEKIIANLQ
jgi:hypothetical protein